MRRPARMTATIALLAMAAGALSACASGESDGSTSSEEVRIAQIPGAIASFPAMVAQRGKIAAEKGLELETIPLNNTTAVSAIVSDSVEVIAQGPDLVITANQQGADLRFFCRGSGGGNWNSILVLADSELEGREDGVSWEEGMKSLEGMNLGVISLGSTTERQVQAIAAAAGIDYEAITVIPVGGGPSATAALRAGQVDAIVTSPFVPQQIGDEARVLVAFDDIDVVRLPIDWAWAASKEWLDADPERAQAVCDSFQESIPFARDAANRSTVDSLMLTEYGLDETDMVDSALADGGPLDFFGTTFECSDVDQTVAALVERGTLTAETAVTCDELLWTPPAD